METKNITCQSKIKDFIRYSLCSESAGMIAIYALGMTIILLQLRKFIF